MQGFLPIPALEAPADGMAFVFSAPKGRPGWAALTGGNLSGFTAGQLAIGASAGGLTQDATLSYSGGVLSASNLKSAGLTSGRVTFATTGGQLTDSANLTYSGGTLSNAGGDTATSGKFLPNNSVNAFLNGSQGAVYGSTTGGGSFPFTSAGNLVLEARGNGNNRAVVLASGGGAFTAYLDAVGTWNVPSTTASTTTSSGAVVIGNGSSGGLGVGGAINVGGGGTFGAKLQVSGSISGDVAANFANTSASGYGLRVAGGTSGQYLLSLNDYASTEYVNVTTATFAVKQTTDSTSTTTGALVVSGGVGIGGALNCAGITSANALNTFTSASTNGTEFDVKNTSTSGKTYAFTSWGSAAAGGSLVGGLSIYDVTAGGHRIYIHTSGRVIVNGTTDNGADNFQVAGTIAATSSVKSSGATAGIGYATGAGGTVTQATSKATGVTLNTVCGTITLNAASLAANTSVAFTWTNSAIAATDYVDIQHDSVGTLGAYSICITPAAGSATVTVRNNTAGALAEAIVLRFFVTKAVTS